MTAPSPDDSAALERAELADLVRRIAEARDRAAFAALFTFYAPRVKAYMMRLGADAAKAEELSQDVLLTVWRKADTFDPSQASVTTWLYTIARNRRIDLLRRERVIEIDPSDPLTTPEPPPAPDAEVERGQREERLKAAVATLPPEQAELLRHAFFGGRSHRELAADFALPLGTVKSRLRLAMERLKVILEGAV